MAGDSALIETLVPSYDAATLSSSHIFVHLKAEDRDIAESANLAALDACTICLRAVFEQKEAALARNLCNIGHVRLRSAHVDNDDSPRARGDPVWQIFCIDTECVINICQNWNSSEIHDC